MTRNPTDTERRPRQPMNWPTATFGIAILAAVVAIAWLCAGVAKTWIGA